MIGDLNKFFYDLKLRDVKKAISSDPYLVDAACIFGDCYSCNDIYNFIRLTGFNYSFYCPELKTGELRKILEEVKEEREEYMKREKQKKKDKRRKR